jgi:WD40 repeat protein
VIPCPDPAELRAICTGTARAEVQAHVESCAECQARLDAVNAADETDLMAALRPSPLAATADFLRRLAAVTAVPTVVAPPVIGFPPGYECQGELASGGMGVVYRARQSAANRTVAVKMIRTAQGLSAHLRARFRTEAEAAAQLQHPHVIAIYEVGEWAEQPFYSMELADGGSLAEVRLPVLPADIVRWLEPVARAIHHAHERGIIHRDLKPANLLFVANTLKVSDFGLAKVLDADVRLTVTGQVAGTPLYMAPEQALGRIEQIGPATDVWALGAVLYELLTGRPPFQGATPAEVMQQVADREPVPLRQWLPTVPHDLETVCLKCLEKVPHQRYARAADLADELARFAQGEPVRARPLGPLGRWGRWWRRRPGLTVLALLLLLVVSVSGPALVVLYWNARAAVLAAEVSLYENRIVRADLSYQLNDLDGLAHALAACPPAQRRWEWHYLAGLQQQALWVLPAGTEAAPWVYALAISPDGHTLATGTGAPTFVQTPPQAAGALRWWDLRTGTPTHTSTVPTLSVTGAAFSPDGQTLATTELDVRHSWHGSVRQWDGATHRVLTTSAPGPFVQPQFDASGRVSVQQTTVAALHHHHAEQTTHLPTAPVHLDPHTGGLTSPGPATVSAVLSPDGRVRGHLVAGGSQLELRAVADGRLLHTLRPADNTVAAFAFSPNGQSVATGSHDGTVQVWSVPYGTRQLCLRGHQGRVRALAFAPSGAQLVSGGWDGTARVWDVTRPAEYQRLNALDGPPAGELTGVEALAVNAAGQVLTFTNWHGTLTTWEPTTGARLRVQRWEVEQRLTVPGRLHTLAANGSHWLGQTPTDIELRALQTGHRLPVPTLPGTSTAVALSADGRWAAVASAAAGVSQLHCWPIPTTVAHSWSLPGPVFDVAISPTGAAWASVRHGAAHELWHVGPQGPAQRWGELGPFATVSVGPADIVATADALGTVTLWSAHGHPLRTWSGAGRVGAVAFTPDGTRLATATRAAVSVWSTHTGERLLRLQGRSHEHDAPFNPRVLFSADGRWLVHNTWDGAVQVWDGGPHDPAARRQAAQARQPHWHAYWLSAHVRTGAWFAAGQHLTALWRTGPTPAISENRP